MSLAVQLEQADAALLTAASAGNLYGLKQALLAGASVDAVDDKERNILHLAACHGHESILHFLLGDAAYAPLLESRDRFKNTPLLLAFEYAQPEAAALLLEHGADSQVRDGRGRGMLRKACDQRQLVGSTMLELALAVDADFKNTIDHEGQSALHCMVEKGNVGGLQLALFSGADPRLRGNYSVFTPRELAEADDLKLEAQLLRSFEALPPVPDDVTKLTIDDLVTTNEKGLRLIDSPRLWRRIDELLPALQQKGETLPDKYDLLSGGVMGYPPLAVALMNGQLDAANAMMAAHHQKLEPSDFWDGEHQNISLFGNMAIQEGLLGEMFASSRWLGEKPELLRKNYHALPDAAKDALPNWQQLYLSVQREHNLKARMNDRGRE